MERVEACVIFQSFEGIRSTQPTELEYDPFYPR